MNVLASRTSKAGHEAGSLTGTIKLNGKVRDDEKFRRISAFVVQVCINTIHDITAMPNTNFYIYLFMYFLYRVSRMICCFLI